MTTYTGLVAVPGAGVEMVRRVSSTPSGAQSYTRCVVSSTGHLWTYSGGVWSDQGPAVAVAGGVSDGDKGDVVVSGSGATWTIDAGAVTTSKLGGDITAAGKALLDDATAADQRATLGLGSAALEAASAFAAAAHTHAAADIASGTIATARLGSGTANSGTFLRGDQTWAAPAGGSDPWTNVVLGSDFSTTGTANANVTGLAFAPSANKRYLIELYLLVRTAAATTGPRPGIAWPSGVSDAGSWIQVPSSNTAAIFRFQGAISTQKAANTGLPTTTDSYLALGGALMIVGASPSGSFQVTLASEIAGSSVTVRAGSFLRYREIA